MQSAIRNPQSEIELTLAQVARMMPGRPHVGTVQRWLTRGVKVGHGPGGHYVRLAGFKCGGRWYITHEAVQTFREAITPAVIHTHPRFRSRKRVRTVADASPHDRAMERLRAKGLVT